MKLPNVILSAVFAANVLLSFPVTAQTGDKPTLDNGTVEQQFEYILDKSHTYEEYRVIKSYMFNRLKKQVTDTMKLVHQTMQDYQQTIRNKDARIDSLNLKLSDTRTALQTAIDEKNTLNFLGISMSKTMYNSIVWFIIAGLALGFIIFILLYKNSFKVIRNLKTDLEDTKTEFEQHRKRALERQEQVVRKYHAELNKYKSKSVKHNS